MSAVSSSMVNLGTKAPDFTLLDTVSSKMLSLSDLKSDKATLIMFICNHCPFVIHINQGIADLAKDYQAKGVSIIAISSNDAVNYPQDSPEKMKENALANNFNFPYLYDESQEMAKQYDAQCTPDFFLYDGDMNLVYRGQFDSSRPSNNIKVSGDDLRDAMDAVLSNKPVSSEQIPSIGCNIKWK